MAKKVVGQVKLQIPAGQANPAPPVGPALGQQGVNIMAFTKEFNARTQKQAAMVKHMRETGATAAQTEARFGVTAGPTVR